ncbi:MAG: hypothetical protein Q4G40_09945 [Brachybacterium sp.]|nr:hypothetical protein [Brachybacterium sp.]
MGWNLLQRRRSVTALALAEGWTGRIAAHTSQDVVSLYAVNVAPASTAQGWVTVAVIPPELRPPEHAYAASNRGVRARATSGGALQLESPSASIDNVTITYVRGS